MTKAVAASGLAQWLKQWWCGLCLLMVMFGCQESAPPQAPSQPIAPPQEQPVIAAQAAPDAAQPQAAPAQVLMVGVWDRAKPGLSQASAKTSIPIAFAEPDEVAKMDSPGTYKLVFVLNFSAEQVPEITAQLSSWRAKGWSGQVIPLASRDSQEGLRAAKLLVEDDQITRYWRYNGKENFARMLDYTASKWLGQQRQVLPPALMPEDGIYHPDSNDLFDAASAYWTWYQTRRPGLTQAPRVLVMAHQSFVILGDTAVLDTLVKTLEQRGLAVAVVFATNEPVALKLVTESEPSLLVTQRHTALGRFGDGDKRILPHRLDVPYLRPVSMLRSTPEQWLNDPRGMDPNDVGRQIALQELSGVIEPIVVGGLQRQEAGFRASVPIQDRMERFADRAKAWSVLRQTQNAQRRVAMIYYNKYLGLGDLGRGSPSGAYLNGPRSMVEVFQKMLERGYSLKDVPADEAQLLAKMKSHGRNVAAWARDELEAQVKTGQPVLIPEARYKAWYERRIPAPLRAQVEAKFGPPPGSIMVLEKDGERFLVLPQINMGNVILMPQPMRGEEDDEELLHSRDLPPTHAYLGFYLWIQEEFKPHALVHFGTHGSLELLPTKAAGLSGQDWGDILVGDAPHIYPWILDNLAEATLAKRRSYATLVDHLVPPIVGAGMSKPLKSLHDDMHKLEDLEEGLLRDQYRASVTAQAKKLNLLASVVPDFKGDVLDDAGLEALGEHLHQLHNAQIPARLHTFGQPPQAEERAPFITSILGDALLDATAEWQRPPAHMQRLSQEREGWLRRRAEGLLAQVLSGKGAPKGLPRQLTAQLERARKINVALDQTTDEQTHLFAALEGRYVPPGPGNDPVRSPNALPTGRNMFGANPEELPTPQAWAVGQQMADAMLKDALEKDGQPLKKVAFDLNGFETMRHLGVTESMIISLLGCRPVWDENRLVIDVELVARQELGRPRVDVFVAAAGAYRDNFPTRMMLLDKAVRLAAAADDEADNAVSLGSASVRQALLSRGVAPEEAAQLAHARIFGQPPGQYGTRILHLIPRTGAWTDRDEIVKIYRENMSHVFTQGRWGQPAPKLYEDAMKGTQVVARTWASHMMSPLTNHHVYEYLGGLSQAVEQVTGTVPRALLADVRQQRAQLKTLEDVLRSEFQVRLFNDKWIEGMKQEGYAGAGQMAELVKNTLGWSVTRPTSIDQATWSRIESVYVEDELGLALQRYFDTQNPHAQQEIAATLLEASRKGIWQANAQQLERTATVYAKSVLEHGASQGVSTGGNPALDGYVSKQLRAPGTQALDKLAQDFEAALKAQQARAQAQALKPRAQPQPNAAAPSSDPSSAPQVEGQVMQKQPAQSSSEQDQPAAAPPWWLLGLAVLGVGVGLGLYRSRVAGAGRR